MLAWKLVENNEEKVIYTYRSFDKTDWGIVEINKQEKTCTIVEKIKTPVGISEWGPMLIRMKEYLAADEYPEKGCFATH